MHFAGSKSVNESIQQPLDYYDNNVGPHLIVICNEKKHKSKLWFLVLQLRFMSEPEILPIPENSRQAPTTPYGQNKQICEQVLQDLYRAEQGWRIAVLRYFNPAGAHPSGIIGEVT